jgi:uncharacterized protein
VKAVFADTFYWIALTNPTDRHAQEVLRFDALLSEAILYTSEEVLTEMLAFFAADSCLRKRAVDTVREILGDPDVRIIPQTHESFLSGSSCMPPARTKATALRIVFRCRRCGGRV